MSAADVRDAAVTAVQNRTHHLIIVNFANPDMVGHTGDLSAAVTAVETVDHAVGALVEATRSVGGQMIVTADHGNCEVMWDSTAQSPHTAHTTNPVPCLLVGADDNASLRDGTLADLAPTLLNLLTLDVPDEMTGTPLILHKMT
jgi:2,3-bisphosphoglycerate-independent phosphoglycerate mutase